MDMKVYDVLADLFEYPSESYPEKVRHTLKTLLKNYPKAADEVSLFLQVLPTDDVDKMQELFIRSFDVQSVTTLGIGYVLFGDDYKRGELLVNLNRCHKEHQINTHSELSDHLPCVLRLMAKLTDEEFAEELVIELVAPAIRKMIVEFNPKRIEEKNVFYKKHYKTLIETPGKNYTLYVHCLRAMHHVLESDFSVLEKTTKNQSRAVTLNNFLGSVSKEIEIEALK